MFGQTVAGQTATANSKPRRGFDYIDAGVFWASYIAWAFIVVELLLLATPVGVHWTDRTRFGLCATTAAFAFVCYGYRLLRANGYRLWWRLPLALVSFAVLPGVVYLYVINPWQGL